MATLLAGALGVAAKHLATLSGGIGEPILLGTSVFIVGMYVRTYIISPIELDNSNFMAQSTWLIKLRILLLN